MVCNYNLFVDLFIKIIFILGISPDLCCDGKQLVALQNFKYILDNLIGRCPSCYFNLLRIFCELACNPNQDQVAWPLEFKNITRPNQNNNTTSDTVIREDWALVDYQDPEENNNSTDYNDLEDSDEPKDQAVTPKPVEKVTVISKIRYFLLEKTAQDFLDSCW